MKPASLSTRILAFVVDLGIWTGIAVVLLAPPGWGIVALESRLLRAQTDGSALPLDDALLFLGLSLLFLVLFLLWCLFFDAYCYGFERRYGATLGKGFFGLSVRDAATGGFPTRRQCLWREVTRPFEVGAVLPALIFAALDGRHRRFGDRMAGTEVVEGSSELARSSFPLVAESVETYRARPSRGPGSFVRRALGLFVDVGIVAAALSPIDLAASLWRWAPVIAEALQGNIDALTRAENVANRWGWLILPAFVAYEILCRRRFGETVGRKMFGLRRESAVGLRSAVIPLLLLPLTLLEGIGRTLLRKPGSALTDRLAGGGVVDVR